MICPKCSKEMVSGYIPACRMALLFVPHEGGKLPKTIYGKGKGTVPLSKTPVWKMQKVEAYYCAECNYVITPVKNLD